MNKEEILYWRRYYGIRKQNKTKLAIDKQQEIQ